MLLARVFRAMGSDRIESKRRRADRTWRGHMEDVGALFMKLTNSVTERKRLTITRLQIAFLSVLGICFSIAALATPGGGVLFNTVSRATVQAFESGSQN